MVLFLKLSDLCLPVFEMRIAIDLPQCSVQLADLTAFRTRLTSLVLLIQKMGGERPPPQSIMARLTKASLLIHIHRLLPTKVRSER